MSDDGVTPEKGTERDWQTPFLEKLAESGNVSRACRAAKVARQTAYRHRSIDALFKVAWDEALGIAVGLLEDEAWRRAREGWLEPVFYKGEKQGSVRKYSDTLLIFLLKAHDQAKYNPPTRLAGADGGTIKHQVTVTGLEGLSDDDLDSLIQDD